MKNRSFNRGRAAITLTLVTLLVKIIAFSRDLILSYCYGSSITSDAYILATTIPVTIFALVFDGIGASLIPCLASIQQDETENYLTNNLINLLILISVATIAFVEFFPTLTIKIFALGFKGEILSQSVLILKFSIIGIVFTSLIYVLTYYLSFHDSFLIPALRSIPMDIVVVISIYMSYKNKNIIFMAVGIPISLLVEAIFLIPNATKHGYKYKPILDFKDTYLKKAMMWSLPVIISSAIVDINAIVDRQFASWLLSGGLSALTYSGRVITVLRMIFITPIITVLFPVFSKKLQGEEIEDISEILLFSYSILIIICIPIVFGVFFLSNDIVQLLFQRGAFNSNATQLTAVCLKYYSFQVIGFAISALTIKVFYSMGNMRIPMITSLIGAGVNFVCNLILSKIYGISGLAMASSLSIVVTSLIQIILLFRFEKIDIKKIIIVTIKATIATVIMSIILVALRNVLNRHVNHILMLVIVIVASICTYFITILFLQVKEINHLMQVFKK